MAPCLTYPLVMGRADAMIAPPVHATVSHPRRLSLTKPLTGVRPPGGRSGAPARRDSRSGRPSARMHLPRARTQTRLGCVVLGSSLARRRRRPRAAGLVACAVRAIWVPQRLTLLRRATGGGPVPFHATAHRVRRSLPPLETLSVTLCDQRAGRRHPPLRWAVVNLSCCPAPEDPLPLPPLLRRLTPPTPPMPRARIRLALLSKSRIIRTSWAIFLIVGALQARGRHCPRT